MRLPLLPLLVSVLSLTFAPAIALPVVPPGAGPTDDAVAVALATVGFTRENLGYRPKGYWNRYPDPVTTPYKLRAFDDLFSEPLKTYDYTRTMANAASRYLDPAYGTKEGEKKSEVLYHLTYLLGVDRLMGGFRNYSANLTAVPHPTEPLKEAIRAAYAYGGKQLESPTFGQTSPWPAEGSPEATMLATIPLELQSIVAKALLNMLEAAHWRDVALRNVDGADLAAAFAIRDLGMTQGDGQVYYPAIDDVAQDMDWQSMGYAWLKTASAAGMLREEAEEWVKLHPEEATHVALALDTPMGSIVLDCSLPSIIEGDPIALMLDLGGNDEYVATVGATASLQTPIAIAVDVEGNDTYGWSEVTYEPSLAYGAGIHGCGVLWDAQGDDSYHASNLGLGAGQLGCGVLYDESGADEYFASTSSQGAAYLGVGLCLDGGGADHYTLHGGEGQGFGGVGGIGILADFAGDDTYYAEPDATKATGRADYHSEFAINVSNAQGVGAGRRGDGSDGHAWAGGMGAILDLAGNDTYTSGNWSLGTGYWYGIGLAWDGAGDDQYNSVYFTQGSGAHFCIGGLFDEGTGNDTHLLQHTAGAALGFGWDFTDALFIDRGGNDHYSAKLISYGCAEIRSNAIFLEMGGDDIYGFTPGLLGFGAVDWQEDYGTMHLLSPYKTYAQSVGLFLDLGGTDQYVMEGDGDRSIIAPMSNNANWEIPAKTDPHYGFDNYGIGIDRDDGKGRVWELERWETR